MPHYESIAFDGLELLAELSIEGIYLLAEFAQSLLVVRRVSGVEFTHGIAHISGNDASIHSRSPDVRIAFVFVSGVLFVRMRYAGVRAIDNVDVSAIVVNLNVGIILFSLVDDSHFEANVADKEVSLAFFEIHEMIHAGLIGFGVAALREEANNFEMLPHDVLEQILLRLNRDRDNGATGRFARAGNKRHNSSQNYGKRG